jgi:hypothetical protein
MTNGVDGTLSNCFRASPASHIFSVRDNLSSFLRSADFGITYFARHVSQETRLDVTIPPLGAVGTSTFASPAQRKHVPDVSPMVELYSAPASPADAIVPDAALFGDGAGPFSRSGARSLEGSFRRPDELARSSRIALSVTGLVMCASNPASRARRRSSGIPIRWLLELGMSLLTGPVSAATRQTPPDRWQRRSAPGAIALGSRRRGQARRWSR